MHTNINHKFSALLSAIAISALSITACGSDDPAETDTPSSGAEAAQEGDGKDVSLIKPQAAQYGFFIDAWNTNDSDYVAAEDNAAVSVLSGMYDIWEPGDDWDNGVKVNEDVADSNIEQTVEISRNTDEDTEQRAWSIDRRHQNYTATEGLGDLAEQYQEEVNAGTTIPDTAPPEAFEENLEDEGNSNGNWADTDGDLGSTVTLVEEIRGHAASTNPSKEHFQYPRPWRWTEQIEPDKWEDGIDMPDYVLPLRKSDDEAAEDAGYPSGHTNAGHLATYGLAYAFPQQYASLLLKAAEIGTSRIEIGMHSPLDVMGGRIVSTAITAGALNDADLDDTKNSALQDAQSWLEDIEAAASDGAEGDADVDPDYKADLVAYTEYLIFGFDQVGEAGQDARVPKGAEALLETRFPYLDEDQRRWVLQTTAVDSGYPLLDDAEGWGRLNMFAAQAGYGSFVTDVTADLDEKDNWRNDIDGAGSLTKSGGGELVLSGDNSYEGGATVGAGTLTAATPSALGSGPVTVDGGVLDLVIGSSLRGDFAQSDEGTTRIDAAEIGATEDGAAPLVDIAGEASLDGTLEVVLADDVDLEGGIVLLEADTVTGEFDDLVISDASAALSDADLRYEDGKVLLVAGDGADAGDGAGNGDPQALATTVTATAAERSSHARRRPTR